jgi:hypothetical protein
MFFKEDNSVYISFLNPIYLSSPAEACKYGLARISLAEILVHSVFAG